MSKVALVRCESYEYEAVKEAVRKGLELLGGAAQFMKAGEKILLKPNLLAADPPEKCSTTNPAVFKAVGELLKETGANLSYGDSPAIHKPETAARKAGLAQVAEELGIQLADFHNEREVVFDKGVQNKRFELAAGVLDSDGLVSISKMKSHGFARVTGAIKNQFGCIVGPKKGEFHVKTTNVYDFARMLVDLNCLIKPRLYITDGILAMEGNGPRGGTPRKMNVLLFSSDPVALDATVCRIINLDPMYVPTIKCGKEAGLGEWEQKNIEIVGEPWESFVDKNFDVKREPVVAFKPGHISQLLRNAVVPRPYIQAEKCVKCGVCVNVCPVDQKAVDWHEEKAAVVRAGVGGIDGKHANPPTYMYSRCIRCYCCQELCPESAIQLHKPLLRRILRK